MYHPSRWEVNCLDLWLGGFFLANRLHGVAILWQTSPSLAAGPTPLAMGLPPAALWAQPLCQGTDWLWNMGHTGAIGQDGQVLQL